MRSRTSILASLLLVLLISFLVTGAPEFVAENPRSVTMNPQDKGILVHEVSVGGLNEPVRIKELTLVNYGNASENELESLQLRYRRRGEGWKSLSLEDLSGIASGITFSLPGDGITLYPDQRGQFQFEVDVAPPERIPISKFGNDVTVELGARFHFVYLAEEDRAVDSVSSNFVVDPGPDKIARAGFEEVSSLSLRNDILQPGTTATIARSVFEDDDPNSDGVEVDLITVTNLFQKSNPLILGQDVTRVRLELTVEEGEEVSRKTITKSISGPTSEVSFSTSTNGWWDGRCLDGCKLTLEVLGDIASSGTSQGMKLQTGVRLVTKENNGMTGYPFNQESAVSVDNVQKIVVQGLEGIEETTQWSSGVVNRGEVYKQRLVLKDNDLDADDFTLNSIRLGNEGSIDNNKVDEVGVYRVRSDGSLAELGTGLDLASEWQELNTDNGRIPDDGRGVFEIHYEISTAAERGTTFKPVVQFQGIEGVEGNARSPVHESTESLTVYPWGAEIAEPGSRSGKIPNVDGDAILAQRLDIMDRDENRLDLLTNPIVIKNLGTATGHDFTKLELYDADGNLLATETDLTGLSTAGVTLGNLDGKTTVVDSQAGNWRTFFIFLTPRPISRDKTLNLKTTLYHTEGNKDVVNSLTGPSFTVARTERATGAPTVRRQRGVDQEGIGSNFGVGIAAGLSYPNLLAFNSKIFLEYLIEDAQIGGGETLEGNPLARFGVDVDSVEDYGYFYPNVSVGYRWAVDEGIHQFAGIGAGPVYVNDTGIGSNFGFHGLFGVTTTEFFEEVPVLLQAKYRYLTDPLNDSVLEVNIGLLYR